MPRHGAPAPGFVTVLLPVLLMACDGDAGRPSPEATALPPDARAADSDTIPPPIPDGDLMPAADAAAGIPPYPGATVWMANRAPASVYRMQAFTPDRWERVTAFYEESLPGWRIVRRRDAVVFQKEPDQASVIVSPWDYGSLPPDAPNELKAARTSIGAAWR